MTFDESTKVLFTLKTAYPSAYYGLTKDDAKATALIWTGMFEHIPGDIVLNAVKAYILGNPSKTPPSMGEINALINHKEGGEMSENEAWALVRKAISNSAWDSEKEFQKLPEVIRKAIGSSASLKEWSLMPTETVDSVVASNFMRSYKAKAKDAAFEDIIPKETLDTLINGKNMLLEMRSEESLQ